MFVSPKNVQAFVKAKFANLCFHGILVIFSRLCLAKTLIWRKNVGFFSRKNPARVLGRISRLCDKRQFHEIFRQFDDFFSFFCERVILTLRIFSWICWKNDYETNAWSLGLDMNLALVKKLIWRNFWKKIMLEILNYHTTAVWKLLQFIITHFC